MSKGSRRNSLFQQSMSWSFEEADESCQEFDSKQRLLQDSITQLSSSIIRV